jgi:hypothetical protein
MAALCLVVFASVGCDKAETSSIENNNINKNHDIFVCGVNEPLQNIEWLKEYRESLEERQNFDSVFIDLYKVIDSDECVFKIDIVYSEFSSPFSYSVDWKNCIGEHIIGLKSGVSPSPELIEKYNEFLKDKEYVATLFHFVKQ